MPKKYRKAHTRVTASGLRVKVKRAVLNWRMTRNNKKAQKRRLGSREGWTLMPKGPRDSWARRQYAHDENVLNRYKRRFNKPQAWRDLRDGDHTPRRIK